MNGHFSNASRGCALGILMLGLAPSAAAQWQWAYGPANRVDLGARRVAAVPGCGGGFVAVGTSSTSVAPPFTSDVYVVRTAANGSSAVAPGWEKLYDIGPGHIDGGESIAVLANGDGFVVAGLTRASAAVPADPFLMRLDCLGNVVWLNLYPGPSNEGAVDVVEARTGDPAFGTAAGDLVAAGFATGAAGDTDGLIFRVRSDGTLLWSQRYDVAGGQESFRALTETRPSTGSPTGDIAAAGRLNAGNDQGFVVRVSGDTGAFGPSPRCAAHYGNADPQRFEALVELTVAPHAGQLVLGGVTASSLGSNDIYLLRTAANPCSPLAQSRIGDPVVGALGDESLYGLSEVLTPLPIAPAGRLALTGQVGTASTTAADNDVFLLIADPATLAPGPGFRYGDFGPDDEGGRSVAAHAGGFVIAGYNVNALPAGDPRDLELIGANGNGQTFLGGQACSMTWAPPLKNPVFVAAAPNVSIAPILSQGPKPWVVTPILTPAEHCQ